jgi:predicted metal-dependent HD superfamily phosphohydrolase
MEKLVEKVSGLWTAIGAQEDPIIATRRFAQWYSTPKRHYHNLGHVLDCLEMLRRFRYAAQEECLIETAIWFHDCIYDTSRHDNEERSAEVTYNTLLDASVDEGFSRGVASMVLATKRHLSPNPDTRLLIDIDLSILGRPWKEFDMYERKIRLEYRQYSDAEYAAGRKAALESFIDNGSRPSIYLTKQFRSVFESTALENIARSIARL